MIPESSLEEGGAFFSYLRVPASALVCSEIASLSPAQHKAAAPFGLSETQPLTSF